MIVNRDRGLVAQQNHGGSKLILVSILAIYLVLAASYSILVPLGEAPDEMPHYQFMRFLATKRVLPVGPEAGSEGFQPPLYYVVGGILTGWIDEGSFLVKGNPDFSFESADTSRYLFLHTSAESFPYQDGALAWHIGRLLSVVLGAITLICTYLIALELFPGNTLLALAATAFNAFIPEFLFMSGAISNDNMVAAFSGLALLLLLKLSKRIPDIKTSAVAGIVIGMAILSKTNALVFLPLSVLAVGAGSLHVSSWQRRMTSLVSSLTTIFVIALLISGGWFWRNQMLYGDLLGWQFKLSISDVRQASLRPEDFVWLVTGLYQSFWGRFGGAAHIRMGDLVYGVLGLLSVVSFAGVVLATVRAVRKRRLGLLEIAPFLIVAAHVVLIFASLIRWTMTYLGTDQARLIYPILSVLAIFFVLGVLQFLPKRSYSPVLFSAIFGIFAISAPFLFVLPNYSPPAVPSVASANGEIGSINGQLLLRGYETNPEQLMIGKSSLVLLGWTVMSTPSSDFWISLQLADDAGRTIYQKETAPTSGAFTTDTWKPGMKVTSLHLMQLPDYIPAGRYNLRVAAHPFGSNNMAPVSGSSVDQSDKFLTLGSVEVVSSNSLPK